MKNLKFTLLSFFLLIASLSWAQDPPADEIPTNPTECYKYLETIMLDTKREDCELIMKDMEQKQKSGKSGE